MKKEALLVCALLILLGLTASVSADAIEEEIDSIVYYAEQYELGKINYLQLVVYENTIREEINSQLGQEYVVEGDWVHRGLTQEDVKRLFGQPTEMTNWVWVINEEHDERIDEKLPRWEKRLFDGRKIIITFNAWPQIIKREDEIIKFYEVDFRIRFKTHYEFNIDDMLKEIEYLGDQYVENKQNGEELVKKAVEYGRFLQAYLEQNNDDCKSVMNDFFDAGDKRAQQKKARFRVHAYEGENLLLRINVEACESCEWPHVNMWFDIDVFGRGFKQKDQKQALEKDIHKSFEELSTEELNAELEKAIKELVLLIREGDKAGRFINPEKIAYYRTALERINRFLDERYYEDKWLREENYAKRLAFLTDLLGRYGDVEKEAITEIRYENRLVEKFEEVTHKYCRHIGAFSCDLDEGCKEGECIAAKGGLEDCHNNIDDDGDGITDCPDPDCAVECGWICKDVCQEECWPCNERECTSVCKECWECKGDCEDVCRDTCWKCQKEKCESQPVCENCQRCQRNAWDEYEEEKCKRICNACEDCADCENCQNGLKYRECRDVCEDTCWECKREKCHDLNVCKMCWDCQERGGDCKSTCDGCWECEKENCYENPICSECKDCEKGVSREIDKERCDKRCKTCDECKEEKGEKACSGEKECRECKDCRAEEKRHLCDDVCGDECWPCNEERCGNQCKTCWQCEGEDKDCEALCKDCWDCTWDRCGSQEFCKSCNECQERIYLEEHPCKLPCDMCGSCTKKGDESEDYCVESCNECFDCETPESIKKCIKVCNKLIEKEDREQREKCHSMCEEEVVFYCNGEPQDTPCLYSYYMCQGGSQRMPCDFYVCTDADGTVVKQTALCGNEHICGEHRIWKDKQCVCEEGWYNCDEDPKNGCETNKACEGVKEICNDMLDNDFDGLIDCQDLSDCEGKRCDPNSDNICKEGSCIINCPENFVLNEDDECVLGEVCMIGYRYDENGSCVKIREEPDLNISTNISTNVTIDVSVNDTTVNVTTVNVTINVSEECLKEGETYMPGEDRQCCDGLEKITVTYGDNGIDCSLPAGYVCTAFCGDGKCEGEHENPCNCEDCKEEDLECSQCGDGCLPLKDVMAASCAEPTEEFECVEVNGKCKVSLIKEKEGEIECPDGYYFKGDKCLFIEDEDEVCMPWQVLNEKGVCEDITAEEPEGKEEGEDEEEEIEVIKTDKRCAVREDCGDENAICSKGICKLLPDRVIEEEEVILVEKVEVELVEKVEVEELPEIPEEGIKEEPREEKEIGEVEEEFEEETRDEEPGQKEEPEEEFEEEESEEPQEEGFTPTGSFILEFSKDLQYLKTEKTTISGLTGWVVKERECEEDKDCGENRVCDSYEGKCHCREYFFDCNGKGEGDDADGCESKDPTCGGRWDACKHDCMPNQVCVEEIGRCECEEGFYDCDGDWENGCESQVKCRECSTDGDCAQSRCTEWDNSVVKFGCVEENPYREEKAVISFSGGCNIKPTGKTESYLNFDTWGEDLDELNELRHRVETSLGPGWCKREIEGLKKQREELENALNQEFLGWFFEEYVASSPAEWEKHISGIFASYWRFVDNARELHEMTGCLEDTALDIELKDIEYKSEYGELHYWEEERQLDGREIITPFMQIWVFPTKDFIKEEFRAAMRAGKMPGPGNEQKGPSPKEIEETKKNEEVMRRINKLSDKYGGSADFLIEVYDEDETLFRALMRINPENIVEIDIINDNTNIEEPDINVAVEFDFLYDTIKIFEQEAHLESPPWARQPRRPIKRIVDTGKVIARVAAAVVSGGIRVSPITATPTVLSFLKLIAGGSM